MRYIRCPLCKSEAVLKDTKTGHLMLRCYWCGFLGFANRRESKEILLSKEAV